LREFSLILLHEYQLVRELIAEYLRTLPRLRVLACVDSIADAYSSCLKHKPDLLITDWHLRDGNGIDLAISVQNFLPRTRVLLLSSNEQEGLVRDAADCGVHGFVSTRQPSSVLSDAIEAMRAGQCYYCPTSNRILLEAMHHPAHSHANPLSHRQRDILRLIAGALSTKDIASRLGLSPKTVANQVSLIKQKLKIHEDSGLVRYALRHGIAKLH